MIVITKNLVLPQILADETNANNPLIGWHSLIDVGNVTADTEDLANPAVNLANPSTVQRWNAADASDQFLTVAISSTDPVDYVAIARHNLSSQQIPISIEGYSELDGGSQPIWGEIIPPMILAGDGPVLFRFAPAVYAGIRVRLQPGNAPAEAAVLYVGKLLVLQRRIYVGHTPLPYGRETKVTNNRSESGEFLGRVVLNEKHATDFTMQNMTPVWYRSALEPFLQVAQETPFFFAWRPGDYPDEVGYAWITNNPKPDNQRTNGMMQIQLSLSGII